MIQFRNFWFTLSLICNGKDWHGLNSFSWNVARKGTSSTVKMHPHNHMLQFLPWRESFGFYSELVSREHCSCLIVWDMGYFQQVRGWYYFLLGMTFLSNAYAISKFPLLWKTWGSKVWWRMLVRPLTSGSLGVIPITTHNLSFRIYKIKALSQMDTKIPSNFPVTIS